ncbi:MAG TPA: hypothetical protein VIX14_00130 [Terriglobales bacterium]
MSPDVYHLDHIHVSFHLFYLLSPQQNVRRVVLMVTDGIDRVRGEQPQASRLGPSYGPVYHSMPSISVDASSASEISQRYNVLVYSVYAVGVGRAGRSSCDPQLGLSGLTKIADETGGECFSLGTSQLVSFKPYLERFQRMLNNQYYLCDPLPFWRATLVSVATRC